MMNSLKATCVVALLWLTGCANIMPSDPTPTAAHHEGDSLALQPSREIGRLPARSGRAQGTQVPLTPVDTQLSPSRAVVSLAPPVDLWDRIRRGYAMPDLDNELVHDREQWYATRPDYIYRMTERSKKYLFHIVEELEMRNMPTELALLPFIESAFNPQAVSGAKAAGMWQFMPATGKYFELKQNAFRDDRRDVLASTRAALDYLQKLYGMFGDWHLALAAYNWGEGSVTRSVAKNQRAGLATGYTDLNMPMETRFYVPKLQAIKNIVSHPDAFNSRLPLIENHPYFQTVTIRRDIDVALAAKLAEVPLEDFKALNPSLSRPVIMAAGTPQVLLPWDNAETFQSNLESFGGGRLASWTVWIAPSTMRAADAAKRVGMSESDFRAINAIPPKFMVKAGSSLLVPRANNVSQDVAPTVADNGQVSLAPEIVLKRTLVKAAKGETVASLARKYKVAADQVAQWNRVAQSASFKPGQQVVMFLPAPPARRAAAPNRTAARKMAPVHRTVVAKRGPATRLAKR
jgi:membrane-bound lytic murein transglycosylase D